MSYKDEIYDTYVTNQILPLYGEVSLKLIKERFPFWDYLYGEYLPENKHSRILDMGCGYGAFVYYLQQKGYDNVEGIDISREQINVGKNLGIDNIQVAGINLWLKEQIGKYDFIIIRDVLEHFTKAEIYEILKISNNALINNGKMMIQAPNGEGIWYEKIFFGDFTHDTLLSRDSARQIFLSMGFNKVDSYSLEFPAINLKSFLRKCAWKIMVMHQKFRKWIATGDGSGIFTPNMLIIAEK